MYSVLSKYRIVGLTIHTFLPISVIVKIARLQTAPAMPNMPKLPTSDCLRCLWLCVLLTLCKV